MVDSSIDQQERSCMLLRLADESVASRAYIIVAAWVRIRGKVYSEKTLNQVMLRSVTGRAKRASCKVGEPEGSVLKAGQPCISLAAGSMILNWCLAMVPCLLAHSQAVMDSV